MSFAIIYMVKNEATILPEAIKYHRALGCSKFFVFLDGTTDNLKELIENQPDVIVSENIDPSAPEDSTPWMSWVRDNWSNWMDLRKMLNTYHTAGVAHDMGIEWLALLDPDELIVSDLSEKFNGGSFLELLKTVPKSADQIRLINLDVLATNVASTHPFKDFSFFFGRFPYSETIWRYSRFAVRKILRSPVVEAWFDQLFFMARLGKGFPRIVRHPVTRGIVPTGYFLSYFSGKALFRCSRAAKARPSVHYWKALRGNRIYTYWAGYVLHFDLTNAESFCAKFRQREETAFVRALYTRWALGMIARDLPVAIVKEFFNRNLVISDRSRQEDLVKRKILVRIGSISDFFTEQHS